MRTTSSGAARAISRLPHRRSLPRITLAPRTEHQKHSTPLTLGQRLGCSDDADQRVRRVSVVDDDVGSRGDTFKPSRWRRKVPQRAPRFLGAHAKRKRP
jgi:hypothetical protein